MHVCNRSVLSSSRLTLGLLTIALGSVLASPAFAADKDIKGWYGTLDLALTQPNSLDQHFADEVDPATASTNRLVIDNDKDFTWRVDVGYSFGKGLGSLQVSYWSFDNEDKQEGTSGGNLYPSIFGYSSQIGYGMYLSAPPASFQATGKVKARTVDLDYIRPIQVGEKFTVKWLAGYRTARYEEDLNLAAADGNGTYYQGRHQEATANGLRVGVTGVFGFTKHFSIEAGMAASFMQAKTEGDSTETFNGFVTGTATRQGSDDHVTGEIRDYDFRAVWNYGHIDYFLGYDVSEWDGLVVNPVPLAVNGFQGSIGSSDRSSVSFNSFHGGVTIRYGKPK